MMQSFRKIAKRLPICFIYKRLYEVARGSVIYQLIRTRGTLRQKLELIKDLRDFRDKSEQSEQAIDIGNPRPFVDQKRLESG